MQYEKETKERKIEETLNMQYENEGQKLFKKCMKNERKKNIKNEECKMTQIWYKTGSYNEK